MKTLIELYLEFTNDYLTLETFAEHKQISVALASLIIKEGRIHHELRVQGFNGLDSAKQKYFETNMIK